MYSEAVIKAASRKGYKDVEKYLDARKREAEARRVRRSGGTYTPSELNRTRKDYNPAKARRGHMLRCYNLTHEDYERMWEDQSGLCKICNQPETVQLKGVTKMLAVDHCHSTGKVRGLLCNNCNRAIGMLKDNPDTLRRAASYLEGL